MDKELFELCKEVYERTGWEDVRDFYHENDTFDEETKTFKRNGIFSIVERKRADYNTPLYTSDYLLEKLPTRVRHYYFELVPGPDEDKEDGWVARYQEPMHDGQFAAASSTTPLKALLKLTIALDEAGELQQDKYPVEEKV